MANIFTDKQSRILLPADRLTDREWPLLGEVAAGYPAEAYNYIEERINLNKLLIRDRGTNGCLWATHAGLTGPGIDYGDLLVVDSGIRGLCGATGIFMIDDEYSLRRIVKREDGIKLVSPRPDIPDVYVGRDQPLERKGVLTHRLKRTAGNRRLCGGRPADAPDYIGRGMDYNRYMLGDWWETVFFLRAGGDSMSGDGIYKGDLLVVDRLAEAREDSILVFVIERQYTLKRVVRRHGYRELVSSNPAIPPIRVADGVELEPWGVLTGVVTHYLNNHDLLYPLRPE